MAVHTIQCPQKQGASDPPELNEVLEAVNAGNGSVRDQTQVLPKGSNGWPLSIFPSPNTFIYRDIKISDHKTDKFCYTEMISK